MERGDQPVLGAQKILEQDPSERVGQGKRSPAPMLFFSDDPDLVVAYRVKENVPVVKDGE